MSDDTRNMWRRILILLAMLTLSCFRVSGVISPEGRAATGDTAEAHLGKGYDALKQDQYDLAATEFRAALDLDPKLVLRARFPLAVALFEMHKSDAARRQPEAPRPQTA